MTDNYDEQISAILDHDAERWHELVRQELALDGFLEEVYSSGLFYTAWVGSAGEPRSLFSNLPGCSFCASQVDNYKKPLLPSLRAEMHHFFHEEHNLPHLENPVSNEPPTQEKLEQFAIRQRLARASGNYLHLQGPNP